MEPGIVFKKDQSLESLLKYTFYSLVVFSVIFLGLFMIDLIQALSSDRSIVHLGHQAKYFDDAMVKVFAIVAGFGATAGFFAAQQVTRALSGILTVNKKLLSGKLIIRDQSNEFMEKLRRGMEAARDIHESVYRTILFFLVVSVVGLVAAMVQLARSALEAQLMFWEFSLFTGITFLLFAMLSRLLWFSYRLSKIAALFEWAR